MQTETNRVRLELNISLLHTGSLKLAGAFCTHGGEHVVQILLVDEAVPVLVDHVERLLELLDLGLVEHGEDVGGGPLGPLLGGLPLGTFARHAGVWMWPCGTATGGDEMTARIQYMHELQVQEVSGTL